MPVEPSGTVIDTNVSVADLQSWHEDHAAARAEVQRGDLGGLTRPQNLEISRCQEVARPLRGEGIRSAPAEEGEKLDQHEIAGEDPRP